MGGCREGEGQTGREAKLRREPPPRPEIFTVAQPRALTSKKSKWKLKQTSPSLNLISAADSNLLFKKIAAEEEEKKTKLSPEGRIWDFGNSEF
jgi:hypothetical protein